MSSNHTAEFLPDLSQLAPQHKEAVTALIPAINKLIQHYSQWFNQDVIEPEDQPKSEIEQFIHKFEEIYPASLELSRLKIALRTVITRLGCFYYRTQAISPDEKKIIETWQPLTESFISFSQRHRQAGRKIRQQGSFEDPFPPVDMITSWVDEVLRENGDSVYRD